MGAKWIVHTRKSFSDGNSSWDFLRIKAGELDVGTELWVSRPRLNTRARIARVIYDVRGNKVWYWMSIEVKESLDESKALGEILVRPSSSHLKLGDEFEIIEVSSPQHPLVA